MSTTRRDADLVVREPLFGEASRTCAHERDVVRPRKSAATRAGPTSRWAADVATGSPPPFWNTMPEEAAPGRRTRKYDPGNVFRVNQNIKP